MELELDLRHIQTRDHKQESVQTDDRAFENRMCKVNSKIRISQESELVRRAIQLGSSKQTNASNSMGGRECGAAAWAGQGMAGDGKQSQEQMKQTWAGTQTRLTVPQQQAYNKTTDRPGSGDERETNVFCDHISYLKM